MTPRPSARRRRAVIATANPDKADEIRAIFAEAGLDLDLVPRPGTLPEVVEDGATLEENARKKAEAIGRATGLLAVADDTGLFVDALGGAPGVRSARYAGEHASYAENVERLLAGLAGSTDRGARFETVAVARFADGATLVATGAVRGAIATAPRGTRGFGYDPVFVPAEGDARSFAEMDADAKHAISHRGRAFRELARLLRGVLA